MKNKGLACGIAAVAVLAVLALLGFGAYNRLVGLDEGVKTAWAQVENVYQRRADLIPNLVETVKGYAAHERETLEAVTAARSSVGQMKVDASVLEDPGQFSRFQQTQDQLSGALQRLMVVVERYPDLKANQNFLDLQVQLEGSENRITVERHRFNEAAQAYNTARRVFPTVLIASLLGFKERPYFTAAPGAQEAPKVRFGNAAD